MPVREKYPSTAFCKGLTNPVQPISTATLWNLELDQMIMKGLFDQSYKILHKDRYHLENIPSHGKVNFTFPNLNVDNPEENLDKDRSFSSTQETSLTKSQEFSLNDPNSESPLILNNQKKNLIICKQKIWL